MTDIDSKACYDCRSGHCHEHGTFTRQLPKSEPMSMEEGIAAGHLYPGPFVVVKPFHREEFSPEANTHFAKLVASGSMPAPDLLHPTGRCTCGGEGQCAWCRTICPVCHGDCYETPCEICHSTGWRLHMLSDYEALGYPETEQWSAGSELAFNVLAARNSWSLMDEMGFIQKDIPDATDIVDSGDTDSYK